MTINHSIFWNIQIQSLTMAELLAENYQITNTFLSIISSISLFLLNDQSGWNEKSWYFNWGLNLNVEILLKKEYESDSLTLFGYEYLMQ